MYTAVAAGGAHSCALGTDGAVTCWGDNDWGQAEPPAGVYAAVAAGGAHSCALGAGGAVTCWGRNDVRESDRWPAVRERLEGPAEAPAGVYAAVAAGGAHSCALGADGAVICWGENSSGQVEAPGGVYTAVVAGDWHSCALGADGAVI